MHDKIYVAIQDKVTPIKFVEILLESLQEDLSELTNDIQFYLSLEKSNDDLVNFRRKELLTHLEIRKAKLIELVSEIICAMNMWK